MLRFLNADYPENLCLRPTSRLFGLKSLISSGHPSIIVRFFRSPREGVKKLDKPVVMRGMSGTTGDAQTKACAPEVLEKPLSWNSIRVG